MKYKYTPTKCNHADYDEYFERCLDCGYVPTTKELMLIDQLGTAQVLLALTRDKPCRKS